MKTDLGSPHFCECGHEMQTCMRVPYGECPECGAFVYLAEKLDYADDYRCVTDEERSDGP